MKALGRLFNMARSTATAATRVNLRDSSGVTFVVMGTGVVTFQQHTAASGGTSMALNEITEFWTQLNGMWTKTTQSESNHVTAANDLTVVEIELRSLDLDHGCQFVSASIAAGEILPILRDLVAPRDPEYIRSIKT